MADGLASDGVGAVEVGFARVVDLSLVFIAFSLLLTTRVVVLVVLRTCESVSEGRSEIVGDAYGDLGGHSRLSLHGVWQINSVDKPEVLKREKEEDLVVGERRRRRALSRFVQHLAQTASNNAPA